MPRNVENSRYPVNDFLPKVHLHFRMSFSRLTIALCIAQSLITLCAGQWRKDNFTVMTFNIWVSGTNVENGTEKIANHIKWVNPDVIGLQVSLQFLSDI